MLFEDEVFLKRQSQRCLSFFPHETTPHGLETSGFCLFSLQQAHDQEPREGEKEETSQELDRRCSLLKKETELF